MNASGGRRKRLRGPAFGEAPTEKVQTLADEQLKKLLDKQLTKETTLSNELRRKQNLCQPILVKDESSSSTGIKTLDEFQAIMEKEKQITSLREHGLTENEIKIKLNTESNVNNQIVSNEITGQLKVIQEKIDKHQNDLSKSNNFSEMVDVSRRDLETECATNSVETGHKFSFLVKLKEQEYSSKDPVIATLKQHGYLETNNEEESSEDDDSSSKFIGPQLCSVNERVDLIPEEVVVRNRLSLIEILNLERFKDYKAGEPNRTLYIKNLAKNTTDRDLAKLFTRYYIKGSSDVQYRMMKGRMRGQAFVTFVDEETATKALLLNNGFKINDKPMIISYSKVKSS